MDQTPPNKVPQGPFKLLENDQQIVFIRAGWHQTIVDQAYHAFVEQCGRLGIEDHQIQLFDVPGSLEIPLAAKQLAKTGNYAIIVAAGLIVDGGIYRHDFVAATVLNAMMQLQLELEVPLLSVVLTPHNFQPDAAHQQFFYEHFKVKGKEAAMACAQTLRGYEIFRASNTKRPPSFC